MKFGIKKLETSLYRIVR